MCRKIQRVCMTYIPDDCRLEERRKSSTLEIKTVRVSEEQQFDDHYGKYTLL